jgi:hypothetical protein
MKIGETTAQGALKLSQYDTIVVPFRENSPITRRKL